MSKGWYFPKPGDIVLTYDAYSRQAQSPSPHYALVLFRYRRKSDGQRRIMTAAGTSLKEGRNVNHKKELLVRRDISGTGSDTLFYMTPDFIDINDYPREDYFFENRVPDSSFRSPVVASLGRMNNLLEDIRRSNGSMFALYLKVFKDFKVDVDYKDCVESEYLS